MNGNDRYLTLRQFSALAGIRPSKLRKLLEKAPPGIVRRSTGEPMLDHRKLMRWLESLTRLP